MKLLFDENLSPKLPRLLATLFPGSAHVRNCGLLGQPDEKVWDYARPNGFTVLSKDSDFQQRSLLYGHPPKFVRSDADAGELCSENKYRDHVLKCLRIQAARFGFHLTRPSSKVNSVS